MIIKEYLISTKPLTTEVFTVVQCGGVSRRTGETLRAQDGVSPGSQASGELLRERAALGRGSEFTVQLWNGVWQY